MRIQTHQDVEYIVIDGGSEDQTLMVVERHRQDIDQIITEPDNGIYDAMNKGIALATGEVIGILNGDDVYAESETLAQIAAVFEDETVQSCYGDLVYLDPADKGRVTRFWKAGAFARHKLYYGWMPPHPTFFVRRSCYSAYGLYRADLGSSADYELMLRYLLNHQMIPVYLPRVLVRMRAGGVSNASLRKRLKAHLMDWRAWRVNNLRPYPWTLPLKPLRKLPQWFIKD